MVVMGLREWRWGSKQWEERDLCVGFRCSTGNRGRMDEREVYLLTGKEIGKQVVDAAVATTAYSSPPYSPTRCDMNTGMYTTYMHGSIIANLQTTMSGIWRV